MEKKKEKARQLASSLSRHSAATRPRLVLSGQQTYINAALPSPLHASLPSNITIRPPSLRGAVDDGRALRLPDPRKKKPKQHLLFPDDKRWVHLSCRRVCGEDAGLVICAACQYVCDVFFFHERWETGWSKWMEEEEIEMEMKYQPLPPLPASPEGGGAAGWGEEGGGVGGVNVYHDMLLWFDRKCDWAFTPDQQQHPRRGMHVAHQRSTWL